jgi:hypothetical protein
MARTSRAAASVPPGVAVREVAEAVADDFVGVVTAALGTEVAAIPELFADVERRRFADARGREHMRELLALLCDDASRPETAVAAAGTAEFARAAVHWDVSADALLHLYQRGHQRIWSWWMGCLDLHVPDPERRIAAMHHSSELFFAYISDAMRRVADAHAAEQAIRTRALASRRRRLVEEIMVGGRPTDLADLSRRLGYELSRHHRALVVWRDDLGGDDHDHDALEGIVREWANALGERRPLVVSADGRTLWAWIGSDGPRALDEAPFDPPTDVRVALGQPGHGLAGFRASHRGATSVQRLAVEVGLAEPVVHHADHETMTLITADVSRLRDYVARHLGGLARDDERAAVLRETVACLVRNGNHQAAAAELGIHRNTMSRRTDEAERVRGRSLDDGRVELALALQLAALHGANVLVRPSGVPREARTVR